MVLRTRCSSSVTTEIDTTETQYSISESEKSSDFSNEQCRVLYMQIVALHNRHFIYTSEIDPGCVETRTLIWFSRVVFAGRSDEAVY